MFTVVTKKSIVLKDVEYVLQVIRPQFHVMFTAPLHILMLVKLVPYGYTVEGCTTLKPESDVNLALHDMGIALLKGEEHLPWWFMASPWCKAPVVGHRMRDYRQVDERHIQRLLSYCRIDRRSTQWGSEFIVTLDTLHVLTAAFTTHDDMIQRIVAKLREMESYRLYRLLNTQDSRWLGNAVQTDPRDIRYALANQAMVMPLDIPNFPFTVVLFMGQQYAKLCMRYPELACYNISVVPSDLVRDFLLTLPTYMEPLEV